MSVNSQSRTSTRDQIWPGRTSTGASLPAAHKPTAIPGWRGPTAPDQSIATKFENLLMLRA